MACAPVRDKTPSPGRGGGRGARCAGAGARLGSADLTAWGFAELADLLLIAVLVLLGASLIVGRLVGRGLARGLRVAPGRGREVMPGLPSHGEEATGRAAVRFDRAVERIEARLMRLPPAELGELEAGALAARFGEPPEVVAAALDDLAARAEHRLRVTGRGRLLYGFTPEALASARRARRAQIPARLALLVLGLLGNLGAAWPLLATLGLAALALAIGLDDLDVLVWAMGAAVLGVFAVFGATLGLGALLGWLLDPSALGPRLSRLAAGTSAPSRDPVLRVMGAIAGGTGRLLKGADDARAALVLLVIGLFLAAVLGALFGVLLWLRGVVRAVLRRDARHLEVSPADWVHAPAPPDPLEAVAPSHDIALGLLDAVTTAARRRRPVDPALAARVVARARAQGGRLSALDLALAEGYDLDEAISLLAQLSGRAGGDLQVSEAGDLDFTWPADVLAPGAAPPPVRFEAVARAPSASVAARRKSVWTLLAADPAIRVNVPGLTWAHLRAADRLAAGTALMAVVAAGVLAVDTPLTAGQAALLLVPAVLNLGAVALAAAARYVARVAAGQGVLRDLRRAAVQAVAFQLQAGGTDFAPAAAAAELHATLAPAWPGLTEADVTAELDAVALDLGLDLDLDGTAEHGTPLFPLAPLRERLASLDALRSLTTDAGAAHGADVVVFDSAA